MGAASCYPFTSYEMCDNNGILLGVNKHNNSLIIVDIFDSRIYKNANMAILGTSGAGKTFTMQLMSLRMRRKGTQVFIVAPLKGHEFHRACTNIGGEFIQISPASKNCINVMEIRRADKSVDELLDGPGGVDKSLLAAKIQRLHIFFSLLIPDMNHEERQLLDDALIRTYAKLGITHENSTLDDRGHPGQYRTMPVLGDLYEVLKESQDTRRLANILNRLVNGSAKTFNQQTNVSLDNKYIVLDISELTGDLLTVGMFVALDFVWDTVVYTGTEIVPEPPQPTEPVKQGGPLFGVNPAVIGGIVLLMLLAALAGLGMYLFLHRKNVYIYVPGGKPRDYKLIAKFRVEPQRPEVDITSLDPYPEGIIAVEIKRSLAKRLLGQTFTVHHRVSDYAYTVLQDKPGDWHEFEPMEEREESI